MIQRTCEECGTLLQGRSDKRFCTDQCRSTHNNRRSRESDLYVREVNLVLRKNRRILDSLNPGGRVKVAASRLKERGFDFRYHTSTVQLREIGVCYYCYDQGYVPMEKQYYLLVIKEQKAENQA